MPGPMKSIRVCQSIDGKSGARREIINACEREPESRFQKCKTRRISAEKAAAQPTLQPRIFHNVHRRGDVGRGQDFERMLGQEADDVAFSVMRAMVLPAKGKCNLSYCTGRIARPSPSREFFARTERFSNPISTATILQPAFMNSQVWLPFPQPKSSTFLFSNETRAAVRRNRRLTISWSKAAGFPRASGFEELKSGRRETPRPRNMKSHRLENSYASRSRGSRI